MTGDETRDAAHPAERRGVALVTALALLALGSALVVGTFGAARSAEGAATAAGASARAEAAAYRGLVRLLVDWDASADSLPIGAHLARSLEPDDREPTSIRVTGSVRRLADGVFLLVVDARVRVGSAAAGRRYRMLVSEPRPVQGMGATRPRRIAGWGLDETN